MARVRAQAGDLECVANVSDCPAKFQHTRLCFLVAALLFAEPPHSVAQVLPATSDGEQWYNWTDDGVRHYVFEVGRAKSRGDTVIVLHGGWGADHSYLVEPLLPLTNRYRFVFYDQRGSLRSPAPDSTISLDRLVADLDDLRQAVGLERITLVAHSMGNALAYAYLAAHPQRVRGLVLVGAVHPAAYTGGPNMKFIRKIWPAADSVALARSVEAFFDNRRIRAKALLQAEGLLRDSARDALPGEAAWGPLGEGRERTRAWRILFATVNTCSGTNWREMRGGQVFYNAAVSRAILSDRSFTQRVEGFWTALQSFRGPVRVIMGTCDYVDPGPAIWPRLVRLLGNGKLTVVENAGHSAWMDQPDRFRRALAQSLGDVAAVLPVR